MPRKNIYKYICVKLNDIVVVTERGSDFHLGQNEKYLNLVLFCMYFREYNNFFRLFRSINADSKYQLTTQANYKRLHIEN